jgi:hypothetical protein
MTVCSLQWEAVQMDLICIALSMLAIILFIKTMLD